MVSRPDPLEKAREYLNWMRQGVFEDDEDLVYPYAFEDEIRKSGMNRAEALASLGVEEDELHDMNFLFIAGAAKNAVEELRRHETEGNAMLAFMCYVDICEFLENDVYEVDQEEALGILGLTAPELDALHQRYAPVKQTIGKTRATVEHILRSRPPPDFDPNMN
ncbi:MAG: hypothetical protein H6858_02155 [Rhodospirillales bacterium]|nr:hypothetical protein [Alphaproteobacteria bacterium]MCB1840185.1 hypothetical protein [Alphaproteobacteria bacterium]MCB9976387.1 hypothetical protein [Rhodospirillales bacterium]